MISKKLVLALSLCAAGSLVPAYGSTCAASGTLDTYIGTTCDIGSLTFHFTSWNPVAGSPNTAEAASSITLETGSNANGTGFALLFNGLFTANGGFNDGELRYYVTGTNITAMFQEIDGSVTNNGYSDINDLICAGGSGSPPNTAPGGCPAANTTNSQTFHSTIVTVNGSGSDNMGNTYTDAGSAPNGDGCGAGTAAAALNIVGPSACASSFSAFSATNSISVQKDIRADATGGVSGATASVTAVYNQFTAASTVPEPGTYVLSFIGLGLMFLGTKKFSRS